MGAVGGTAIINGDVAAIIDGRGGRGSLMGG